MVNFASLKLYTQIMKHPITIKCETCGELFLDMPWGEYLTLLGGTTENKFQDVNLFTPTKTYNKVVLHYCQNPTHQILSNITIIEGQAFNDHFNFTEQLTTQLTNSGVKLEDLYAVAKIEEIKTKDLPI